MSKILSFAFMIVLLCGIIVAFFLPNPFLRANFTTQHWQTLNDKFDIEELSKSVQPTTQPQLIDWNTVSVLWDCFVDTKVFDILSGQTFCAQRTGGTNHADIEPLSSSDSKILESILASSKSRRRPVLVLIKNLWIAGSMATALHGYGLITNNQTEGHLCLHFLNSKTESTKQVDALHQKTVLKAHNFGKNNIIENK